LTTTFQFTPTIQSPFSFKPTLDGEIYNVTCPWNIARQSWFISIAGVDGTSVVYRALVGSPAGQTIESITWSQGLATITTEQEHGLSLLATVNLTVSGVTPDAYNGQQQMFVTGPNTLVYALSTDPGSSATSAGVVSYDLNLAWGYFTTSTLVYRQPSNQFEVNP
jgi:hypothetical protein